MQKNLLRKLVFTAPVLSGILLAGCLPVSEQNAKAPQYKNPTLEKVVIVSRHGIRSPEEDETKEALAQYTPYKWADWKVGVGHLTEKGAQLETYFGQYLNEYLTQQGLLNKQECDSGKNIRVYSNSVPRTISTGKAITAGAFANCNVKTEHQNKIGETDPIFSVDVRTDSEDFKKKVLSGVDLAKTNDKLEPNHQLLAELIDFKNSNECRIQKDCTFIEEDGHLRIEKGKRPSIKSGDLRVSKSIVNALLLQYYEGLPADRIAGGNIDTEEEWLKINKIKDEYFRASRGYQPAAAHIAYPLIKTIRQDLEGSRKISVLVGHDSNIVSLLSALGVKDYTLPGQFEKTPIGGKVFFEIWKDSESGQKLVKTKYVYQSAQQLRKGEKLSLASPPKEVVLEMDKCKTDRDGFCDYADFNAILDNIAKMPVNAD